MFTLHYAPDNASLIVRLVLEEMGLPYTTALVDRRDNAQRSEAYLKVNPMGLIPALETPDGPIFETAAILLWLSEHTGKMAPAPAAPERGVFLSWLFAASNGLHADLRQVFYAERYSDAPADHRLRAAERIGTALDRFEGLAGQNHNWFAGKQPSVLDIYVTVMMRWLALYPKGQTDWFDIQRWPLLHGLASRLEARASTAVAVTAEGLGKTPLSAPRYPQPPEGSAL
ncbi:glutathione S-transferase family protein [Aliiroseovarius sp. 2305UL8-7]|uniref:glutathione S-transferase family protein n=1 Tax=Aliiroseovarius conchicola TaxID=3121637 RepID=UPI003526F59C